MTAPAGVQDGLFTLPGGVRPLLNTAPFQPSPPASWTVIPRPVHDTPAILHAVMTDPLPARQTDREHIEAAIRAAAAEHGGYVTAAWVRPHITRDVLPQMVGAVMGNGGLLEPTERLERNAGGSGNALKWSPVWRLIPVDTRKH